MSLSPEPHLVTGGITPEPPADMLPVHMAASKNNVEQLIELVDKGEKLVDPVTKETPLHAAARAGSKDALEYILREKLVSPTALSVNGYTAAHFAALYRQQEILKVLLTYDSGLSDQLAHQQDETGLSLLSLATLEGNTEMVSWLMERYPDLASIANSNGNLPVHFAAAQGHLDILKILVSKCGKEMTEKSDSRQTKPVYFAAQEGKLKILDYLINDLGVDPVARDKAGMSSIHAATQGSHPSTAKWLINKLGPSYILDKTIDGATPLHMAAAQGQTDVLRFFLDSLENESDVDIQDHIRATPAHDAAEYGQTQSMLLLLKYGANVNIKDTENKTPYELAVEQNHSVVASMIADYRDSGISALTKYEKKKRSREEGKEKSKDRPRTSMQEAAELSSVIQATTEVIDKRKEQNLQRQESLQKMNEVGLDNEDEFSREPKANGRGGRKHRGFSDEDNDDIEHTLGPLGGIYARPSKKSGRSKTGSRHNSDIEDFIEETMSHRSYSSNKHRGAPYQLAGLDDAPYASINHETASNVSRPSRVKRYHDSDSEISSFAGSAGHFYSSSRPNMPGHYPMAGPYGQMYAPPLPPPRGTKGPRSVASSRQSSQGSQYSGHPLPYGAMPYGFNPNMVAAYYGYPAYGPGYGPHNTTQDRMHMEMMRRGGQAPPGMPMYGPPPGLYMQRHRLHHQQKAGRRSSLLNRKKKKGQPPSYDASAEHSGTHTPRKHTDQDIGYGPSISRPIDAPVQGKAFHPPAPPITHKDGTMDTNEVVAFDSNFIMAKKTEDGHIRHVGETTLNPSQAPKPYDGRYDKYIMTDSEEETDLPDHISVSCGAEAAAIIAIGCVAGLRGLSKMRKEKPSRVADSHRNENPNLSSAWDSTNDTGRGVKNKHGGSSTALDDPLLRGMSPEEFASHEEWDRSDWDGAEKKKKKKKKDKGASSAKEDTKKKADPEEPQSELLTAELKKFASASVSKSFGEQILTSALGARHSSMLNIASSAAGSRMSLNVSSEGEDDDDDFNAAISMVTGTPMREKINQVPKPSEPSPGPSTIDKPSIVESASKTKDDKKKESKNKSKKDKESEEQKAKIKREKKEKKEQKEKEKREKKAKKEKKGKSGKDAKAAGEVSPPDIQTTPPPAQAAPTTNSKSSEPPKTKTTPSASQEKTQTSEKTTKVTKVTSSSTAVKTSEQKVISPQRKAPPPPKKETPQKKETTSVYNQPPPPSKQVAGKTGQTSSKTGQASSGSSQSGPREVENRVSMFDTESESEGEEVKAQKTTITGGADFMQGAKWNHSQVPTSESEHVDIIEADDQSLDIFGAEGLAELNEALRELTNIQSSFSTDPVPVTAPPPLKSAAAGNVKVTKTTSASKESKREVNKMEKGGGSSHHGNQATGSIGRIGTGSDSSVSSGGVGEMKMTQVSGTETQTQGLSLQSQRTQAQHSSNKSVAATGTDTSSPAMTTTGVQGTGYSSSFEHNVLGILQGLTETMHQMKANPSVTQTEINQQELLQQQTIQNLISYSEKDPELTKKLLELLKREQGPGDDATSTRTAFEMLEQKLLQAQEIQSRQAKDYFRTQEEFQQAIQKKLEEQAEQQLKLIQSNFEKYSQLLSDKSDKKKRSKDKKHKKHGKHHKRKYSDEGSSASSGSSDSEDGLVRPMKHTAASKPDVKTMHARIYHQDLLDEDSMRSSSQSSLTGKLREKQISRLKRQDTSLSFDRTRDALKRFESTPLSVDEQLQEEEDEDSDVDDEMQFARHARPATLKRADIMTIQNNGPPPKTSDPPTISAVMQEKIEKKTASVTFAEDQQKAQIRRLGSPTTKAPASEARPESFDENALKYGHHVETNEHKKNVQRGDTTVAGAGGELAAALKLRQRQIGIKNH